MTQHDCANCERPEFAGDGYREDKGTPLVFNRAMQWLRPAGGNIICYSTGGVLPLTAENQVSRWVSDPANLIEHAGDWTIFQKHSAGRHDWPALPAFQFSLLQHRTPVDIEGVQVFEGSVTEPIRFIIRTWG